MRCAAAPGGSRSPRPGPRRGRPGEAVARGLHVPAPPAPRPAPRAPARRPPRRPGRERARPEGRAGAGRGAGGDSETLRGPPRARCGSGDARLRAYFLVPEEARKRREDGQRPPVSPTLARGPPSRWGRPGTPGAHGLGGAHLPGARVCKQTARLISLAGARAEGGGGASARAQGRPRPGRRRARLRPHLPTSCPPAHLVSRYQAGAWALEFLVVGEGAKPLVLARSRGHSRLCPETFPRASLFPCERQE